MNQAIKKLVSATAMILTMALFWVAAAAQQNKEQCKGCQMDGKVQQMGSGMMGGKGMMGGEGRMEDMQTIHGLFADNTKIKRTVKNIANGVEATTESDDPKVKAMIIEHTWAMKERLAKKQPIRQWDPLFAALFEHADKIKMEVTNTAKGVKVVETSADAYVVKLIQSHAQGVSEFVNQGMASMHKRHELPDVKPEANKFFGKGDGVTTCPVTGEPVNKQFSAELYGRTVYFCCANCRDAVKKNPEMYLKANQMERNMQVIKLQTAIGEGKDKQIDKLFSGSRRTLVQITLRNSAILEAHKAAEPITVQCIAGKGTLQVGSPGETVELLPGVLVTIEPNILHEIKASPAVSILLSKFADK